jgi:DNA-binding transcriptional ArsR family regulator
MSLRDLLEEDRRLVILRSLVDVGGEANESILNDCLDAYGHRVSRDQVRAQLAWLQEQGVVTIEMVGSYMVATLTGRGQDVAEGRCVVPGIKKPRARG